MVMVDTGFWLALANKKDEHHEKAKSILANINSRIKDSGSGRVGFLGTRMTAMPAV